MNFNQDGVTKQQILRSLRAMIIEGGFKADSIIIDGFDFNRLTTTSNDQTSADKDSLALVKDFAIELGLCVWYSCSVKDDGVIPASVDQADILVLLQPKPDYIELSLSKDRGSVISKSLAMKLDPKTLLILEA
jgi:hypothetical protein